MSKCVLIGHLHDPAAAREEVPLAGERTFQTYWVPAARRIGLKWFELFSSGAPVRHDDLDDVLIEVQRLKNYFTGNPAGVPDEVAAAAVDQLRLFEEVLLQGKADRDLDIFVG